MARRRIGAVTRRGRIIILSPSNRREEQEGCGEEQRQTESRHSELSQPGEDQDRKLTTAARKFQRHKAGDRNRKIELAENRFEVGKTAGERIDRNDVAVTGRG